jgi:hypothetical protein
VDISPQENYIDLAVDVCRWSECRLLLVQDVAWSLQRIPMAANLGFLDRNVIKYLGVIFDKNAWRTQLETLEAKAFRTFTIMYSVFKSERLSTNIKLNPTKFSLVLQWLILVPPGNLRQKPTNCISRDFRTKFSVQLTIFLGQYWFAIWMPFSKFHTFMIT